MNRARRLAALLALALTGASGRVSPPVPPELATLAAKAGLDRPVIAWCRGEFRAGASAYAVAVSSAQGGGRYLVLDGNGSMTELAPFADGAELACYTPAAARRLSDTIRKSETIEGRITPSWNTTVVCGFVANTEAVCWQRSPSTGAFVTVGGWTT